MGNMTIIEVHYPNAWNDFGIKEPRTAQLSVDEDLIDGLSAEQVAEEVFRATNAFFDGIPSEDTLVGQIIADFLAQSREGRWFPTLSVGDVVRVPNNAGGVDQVLVEPIGFRHLGENNIQTADTPDYRGN